MNSYHNQCRRGPAKGECSNQVMPRENEGCPMPKMPGEKECCSMPMMPKEQEWPIGMTYVPMQPWREFHQPEEGFHRGTIFKELDLPFLGRRMC